MEASHRIPKKSKRSAAPTAVLAKVDHERLSDIMPSPENDQLYRPPEKDPEIALLARSIREHGVLEPLILSADGYIVSGHRRYAAAKLARLQTVPCRRLEIYRTDDIDVFVRLLREHNRQRDKSNAERMREELVDVSPEESYEELCSYRRAQAVVGVVPMAIGAARMRKSISAAKMPMLRAVQKTIDEFRSYWPLADRQIHYILQNDPPLIHANKPDSVYANNKASYRALIDLLTRARLAGLIPFEAIGDETRAVELWNVHPNPRAFLRREVDGLFRGYWRNLMQSDPNHIEGVIEKLTIRPIAQPVFAERTIPTTIGRGFCSLAPRHAMAQRFKASGKEKLVLLVVSDFDPEGESIAESFARSMRDDFGIRQVHAIKAALTAEQVAEHELPPILTAKESSSRFKQFTDRHGHDVFELEALPPDALRSIISDAINSVVNQDNYFEEMEAERQDSAFIEKARRKVLESLKEIDFE